VTTTCEECKRDSVSVAKSYRLNPRNWTAEYRRLCRECRTKLHFEVEGNSRQYAGGRSGTEW